MDTYLSRLIAIPWSSAAAKMEKNSFGSFYWKRPTPKLTAVMSTSSEGTPTKQSKILQEHLVRYSHTRKISKLNSYGPNLTGLIK